MLCIFRLSYNEFIQKYGRDSRFKAVEKSRDRESYFMEHATEMKKREKEERAHSKEKVGVCFESLKISLCHYLLEMSVLILFIF